MNASVKTAAARRHPHWQWSLLSSALSKKQRLWLIGLVGAIVVSAFSLIYVTSLNRQLVSEQQELLAVQSQLHNQWGQLLLEQGAYSNQATIANMAEQKLGMQMPVASKIVMVRQ
jgi:cell division protein FtsL